MEPGSGIEEVAIYVSHVIDLPFREATHWRQLLGVVRGSQVADGQRAVDHHLRALCSLVDGGTRPVRL